MQINVPDSLVNGIRGTAKGLAPILVAVVLVLAATGQIRVPLPHFPSPLPAPKPDAKPEPAPKPDWFGLRYNEQSRAVLASLPRLAQVAPHLMTTIQQDTRPVLLYKAWTDLFRSYPPYVAQEIGDCVSFGHGHANDLLQCIEWVIDHPGERPTPADIQETDTEFIYGASREVGGMLGPFDGSYGGAAVKAMTEVGVISRRMMGSDGSYSGRRAKQFGRTGPPDDWKAKAAAYKLGAAARVESWDELAAALRAGHPVTICTGMGFGMRRDSQGFCKRQGRWGHCMFIAGVRFDRPGACIVQSWGQQTPSGPTALDQPSYSFWADRRDIEAILAEGDSFALSKSPHFGGARAHPRSIRAIPRHWRTAG